MCLKYFHMPTHCVSKGQLSVPLSYPCQMGFVHVSWQLTQVISRKVRYCNACVKNCYRYERISVPCLVSKQHEHYILLGVFVDLSQPCLINTRKEETRRNVWYAYGRTPKKQTLSGTSQGQAQTLNLITKSDKNKG